MTWNSFIWFALPTISLSLVGAVASLCANEHWSESSLKYRRRRKIAIWFTSASLLVMTAFIIGLWLGLDRPPLRTMGETRLWFSFFTILSGLFTYLVWRYRWILSFSTVLASVFVVINLLKPETHDPTLMPALQSPWLIPHVTVYMFSYSLLGCAFILGLAALTGTKQKVLTAADTLVYIGTAFMTIGMLSGAIWAKSTWGHFWNWDPKETWALVTWLCYLFYIHLRLVGRASRTTCAIVLILSFICLQMCWWGVNYLPSAQDSIHVIKL